MEAKRESSPQTRTSNGETGLAEVAETDVDAPGGDASLDGNDEVAGVVGDLGAEEIDGTEQFAVEFAAKD